MLRDLVGPELRLLGFKGSGRLFSMDDHRCWSRLGFQASRYNSLSEVRFTVNLCVVDRERWLAARAQAPHLPAVPVVGHYYGRHARLDWQARIGELMPGR